MKEFNKERFEVLIAKCSKWSKDRNIIKGSTALDQSIMLVEELGELATGIRKDNKALIIDAIGDIVVVLNGMCLQLTKENLSAYSKHIYGTEQTEFCIKQDLAALCKSISILKTGVKNNPYRVLVSKIHNVLADLNYLCIRLDITLDECLEQAYNEIKDRKGIMFNGSFIKSSDKDYTQICRLVAGSIAPNGNIIK